MDFIGLAIAGLGVAVVLISMGIMPDGVETSRSTSVPVAVRQK